MNLDHPRSHQIPALRALWQEAFGDSEAALNLFFDNAYAPERCFCITDGDAVVAAAYWLDCSQKPSPWGEGAPEGGGCGENNLSLRDIPTSVSCADSFSPGRSHECAYIYAVATAKSHRGRGLCHKLMDGIHAFLTRHGYAGAIVVPGEESLRAFYGGMGYENFGGIREFSCEAAAQSVSLKQLGAAEFAEVRRANLPAGAILQEDKNLAYLASYAQFYAGDDFLLTAARDGAHLLGLELLGNADAASGILAALDKQSGSFRTPGEAPFAMYKALNAEKSPTYFGFAFD